MATANSGSSKRSRDFSLHNTRPALPPRKFTTAVKAENKSEPTEISTADDSDLFLISAEEEHCADSHQWKNEKQNWKSAVGKDAPGLSPVHAPLTFGEEESRAPNAFDPLAGFCNLHDYFAGKSSTLSATVSVKVKWKHVDAFSGFDVPLQGGYESLIKEVKKVQPEFNDALAYKDECGDLMLMSSQAEFARAASLLSSQPALRLHVMSQNITPTAGKTEMDRTDLECHKNMPNNNVLQVKWKHHGSCRRFEIPAEVDFRSFMRMINELEPTFSGQLAWKDEEGDVALISSKGELASALSAPANKQLLRLVTYEPEETAESEPTNQSPMDLAKKALEYQFRNNALTAASTVPVGKNGRRITVIPTVSLPKKTGEGTMKPVLEIQDPKGTCEQIIYGGPAPLLEANDSTNVPPPEMDFVKELKKLVHEQMANYGMDVHVEKKIRSGVAKPHGEETGSDWKTAI